MKIVREAGYSHADFFRLLPGAMGSHTYVIDNNVVRCSLPSGTLTITIGPEKERRLVLVVIPYMTMTFEFDKVAEADRNSFMKYFDLRFMKGLA